MGLESSVRGLISLGVEAAVLVSQSRDLEIPPSAQLLITCLSTEILLTLNADLSGEPGGRVEEPIAEVGPFGFSMSRCSEF